MVNLINDLEKHELGPWHPELFPELSRDTRCKIKFLYLRNHPCQQIPNGLHKCDHPRLCVYHCPHFSMKMVGLCTSQDTGLCFDDDKILELQSQCHSQQREHGIWYDAEGEKLIHYFAGPLKSSLHGKAIEAFRTLVNKSTLTVPKQDEKRSARFLEWCNHIGMEKKSGVICMTFHHQQNHSRQNPPNPSSDFLSKSGKKTMDAAEFRKSTAMINAADRISIMFAAVDP
jgi:hypothetical protein